jgi:hypothetical protein
MPDPFDKEQAQELVEDIEGDLLRLARIHGDLEKSDELIRKWDQQDIVYHKLLEAAGTELHGLYTGTEKIFERIIIFKTGQRPQGKDFHKSILKTVHEELKLTSSESNGFLERLSSFRHLFRHAYGIEWDPSEIVDCLNQTKQHWPAIRHELESFLAELKTKLS